MAIVFETEKAIFSGVCVIEDAEPLWLWFQQYPQGKIDLEACEHLHAAVVQLLLAYKPVVVTPPVDPFLRAWIVPALGQ